MQIEREFDLDFVRVSPEKFINQREKLVKHLQPFITLFNTKEYCQMNTRLYLDFDEKSGFGINPDGTLISVFSLVRGRGSLMVRNAVWLGATKVECLGEKLFALYVTAGYRYKEVYPWDDNLAPNDWDYTRFGKMPFFVLER